MGARLNASALFGLDRGWRAPDPIGWEPARAARGVWIRPVRPHDAAAIDALVRELSPQSRLRRFHAGVRELPPELLHRFTHPDPQRELALVALTLQSGREVCIAEARYAASDEAQDEREFALTVADPWQRTGIGGRLLRCLTEHAQRHRVARLYGDVMRDNGPMLALARSLGYVAGRHPDDPWLLRVSKALDAALPSLRDSAWMPGRAGASGAPAAR